MCSRDFIIRSCPTLHQASRLRVALLAATVTIPLLGCQEDSISPTDPDLNPALAMAAAPSFREVSAGSGHSCGVTTTNQAYCWGWNVFGQVGNGSTRFEQTRPALVRGGLRFRQVSAGSYRTCGVTTEFLVYCWGDGYGLTPSALPGGRRFRQVSVGEEHACAVTSDDRAFCWGLNGHGQLGDGTNNPQDDPRTMPVAVVGGLLFKHVSAGHHHTCGVTTTNRPYCWGSDRFGQIGDGPGTGGCFFSNTNLPCRKRPTLVAGGYRFRQIEAGGGGGPGENGIGGTDGGRTCAVTPNDRAFCWGDGSHGQNGNGMRSITNAPQAVAGGLHFRGVSAGLHHTCGVTTENRAYCWGWNSAKQLGDGTQMERLRPRAVVGGHLFRQVSAGGAHTCGTTPSSAAYCWGGNSTGSLGDGTTMSSSRPRAVVGPS
jgi:alpha-tubulin suppressor-like RCC1 family protein